MNVTLKEILALAAICLTIVFTSSYRIVVNVNGGSTPAPSPTPSPKPDPPIPVPVPPAPTPSPDPKPAPSPKPAPTPKPPPTPTPTPTPPPAPTPAPQVLPISGTIHATLVWSELAPSPNAVDLQIDKEFRDAIKTAGVIFRAFPLADPLVTSLGYRPTIEKTLAPLVIFQTDDGSIVGSLHDPDQTQVAAFVAKLRGGK